MGRFTFAGRLKFPVDFCVHTLKCIGQSYRSLDSKRFMGD